MAKVLEAGFKPSLVILEEVGDHETWQQAEKRWISKALDQGWPLTNTSSGGDGSSPLNEAEKALKKAYMSSEETRRKMSESAKARWADPEKRARGVAGLSSPERRKVGSDEAKKRATPEYRAMMSEKTRSMWADPERRAVIVAGITDETRAAVSAAASRMWNESDDEKRAKMLANLTANQ
jgi:hypothetical protein